jgi:hypothetical protein
VRTAFKWVHRAHGQRLDRVNWNDASRGNPKPPNATRPSLQKRILRLRVWLQQHSALGEYGADAIRRHLQKHQIAAPPSARTIARIVARHGLVSRSRQRRPAPPPGWYLPDLVAGTAELDSFDFVESLAIQHRSTVEVLNGISLCGSLAASWPAIAFTTSDVLKCLPAHWRIFGQPRFAQFDNDTRFQGSHQKPACLGRVVHLCLCLGVVPVFAPPRETGFQAKIESYNDLWQDKVWHRWRHASLSALRRRSARFVCAHRDKHAARIDSAPLRWPSPLTPARQLTQPTVIFVRRTNERGQVRLLDRTVAVDRHWPHRLVRCELDVLQGQLQLFALRRRQPDWQPLLAAVPYPVQITPWHRPPH